jgi:broad specificity phosphatase PhoE
VNASMRTGAELILVRHAPTAWSGHRYCGRSDPPLAAHGRAAAVSLASALAATLPAGIRVVTSPLRRARDTASAIAALVPEATVVVDDRWREVDFGIAEGRTFDELAALLPTLAARLARGDTEIDWPDGERARAFADRVRSAWSELVGAGLPAVVVSHAGPLRVALAIARDLLPADVDRLEPASFVRLRPAVPEPAH